MFRTSDVILIAVMLSAAAFTYKTKHDAEAVRDDVRRLEAQIQLEKDAIDVLKADWSLFTQPGRLSELADAYRDELGLQPLDVKQIAEMEALGQIPFRAGAMVARQEERGAGAPDPTVTGGVRP